jgi:hypothetical protein
VITSLPRSGTTTLFKGLAEEVGGTHVWGRVDLTSTRWRGQFLEGCAAAFGMDGLVDRSGNAYQQAGALLEALTLVDGHKVLVLDHVVKALQSSSTTMVEDDFLAVAALFEAANEAVTSGDLAEYGVSLAVALGHSSKDVLRRWAVKQGSLRLETISDVLRDYTTIVVPQLSQEGARAAVGAFGLDADGAVAADLAAFTGGWFGCLARTARELDPAATVAQARAVASRVARDLVERDLGPLLLAEYGSDPQSARRGITVDVEHALDLLLRDVKGNGGTLQRWALPHTPHDPSSVAEVIAGLSRTGTYLLVDLSNVRSALELSDRPAPTVPACRALIDAIDHVRAKRDVPPEHVYVSVHTYDQRDRWFGKSSERLPEGWTVVLPGTEKQGDAASLDDAALVLKAIELLAHRPLARLLFLTGDTDFPGMLGAHHVDAELLCPKGRPHSWTKLPWRASDHVIERHVWKQLKARHGLA